MIVDQLKNIDFYKTLGIGDRYAKAIEWLKSSDLAGMEDGRYEIDGETVYASVMSYATIPWEETVYEAHERYTDIQYMISGTEIMSYAPVHELVSSCPYDPEKDVILFDDPNPGIRVSCRCGDFVIFFPWDGHKPRTVNGKPSGVRKVVVKILEK